MSCCASQRVARSSFFFFQAEDGIRDTSVTGVQTCALPIWDVVLIERLDLSFGGGLTVLTGETGAGKSIRSEERRVGKECRSRRGADHEKKKHSARRESRSDASTRHSTRLVTEVNSGIRTYV